MNKCLPLLLLAGMSCAVQAQDSTETEHKIGIKYSRLDQTLSVSGFSGSDDDKGNVYGVEYTALRPISDEETNKVKFGVNVAFDITTLDYDTSMEADLSMITLAPVISYSPIDEIDIYAKGGFVSWDVDLPGATSLSGIDFIYGLGITYQSPNGAYSGLELTQFEGQDDGITLENTMASIKVGFKF